MNLPADYGQRVYAGVLGKIIGVYMGRPFEGWRYEQLVERFGRVDYYVNEALGKPLIVPDDDITGTFTFFRALADHGCRRELTARQIGGTWLNYLIDRQTILWWGGMGQSTEHTAYLRLRAGVPAPRSGSIELNGPIVAEQIGAQIFIDAWGMAAPGDPELAAHFAKLAGSVSHDGEAVHGAQVVAALVAMAFVEPDIQKMTDAAVRQIPADCVIARLIADVRRWRAEDDDWHKTFARIKATYGYDKYGGNCHMVPNHALIHLALQYAPDSFQLSQAIVNTAGWDTDCNAANVGAIMGVKLGLAGIDADADFRGPVADRMLLPTADAGRCITDAAREAVEIANAARRLHGVPADVAKNGARWHFELPGSVQGWTAEDAQDARGVASVANVEGHSDAGRRCLAVRYRHLTAGRPARIVADTFVARDRLMAPGYRIVATPAVWPGQTIAAAVAADAANAASVDCRLLIRRYREGGVETVFCGEPTTLAPGRPARLECALPAGDGRPICQIGLELSHATRADGAVYLDWLDVAGVPQVAWDAIEFTPADPPGGPGRPIGWVVDADHCDRRGVLSITKNDGLGVAYTGGRQWAGYAFAATLAAQLAERMGVLACLQGMRRYYALQLVRGGRAQLIRVFDERTEVLAEAAFAWEFWRPYELSLAVKAGRLTGRIGGQAMLEAADDALADGAAGVLVETGRINATALHVGPS